MTKEDKDALYDKSEYNSVRLFSGKKLESDTRQENTFTRAKNYLDKWIEDGILVRDEEPVIYMYEQTDRNVRYSLFKYKLCCNLLNLRK